MEPRLDGGWRIRIVPEDRPHYALADVRLDGNAWFGSPCEDGGSTDEEHIWTSPIWFEAMGPVDADADGYTDAEGDCDDTSPFVSPAAAEACSSPDADHDCDGSLSQDDPDCAEDTAGPQPQDTGLQPDSSSGVSMRDPEARGGKATCSSLPADATLKWMMGSILLAALRRRRA